MLAQEIIRTQRDGLELSRPMVDAFVAGLTDGSWSDSQAAAMAMAIVLRGLPLAQTVMLTQAMLRSGEVLDWAGAGFDGPVLDKHSTGGVGDSVSLLLAPIVAACGGVVPMISGRGLGHTGGTLDKLEALPGYTADPPHAVLRATLRHAGCAIVGASARLAPADARLYAIRDVTGTVESVPLITASILSKKLAAGLDGLVLDVKCGSGAFSREPAQAAELADSLVRVALGAGLSTLALVTDMNQPLGRNAGNALEVVEVAGCLAGEASSPRLVELTLALAARLLQLGRLAPDLDAAHAAARQALASGAAAERFERMVAGLGGPRDALRFARGTMPQAPVQRPVPAPRGGVLTAIDVRALGLAVVALGGGRRRPGDRIDPRVGLAAMLPLGTRLAAGDTLAVVHAADAASADAARAAVQAACRIDDGDGTGPEVPPLIHDVVEG